MVWTYAFAVLVFAHIMADFAVRREILRRGAEAPAQPDWEHLAVLGALSVAGLAIIVGPAALVVAALTVALHYLIDRAFARTSMWQAEPGPGQRWLFTVQQGLKVLVMALVACIPAAGAGDAYDVLNNVAALMSVFAYVFGYAFALFVGDAFVCFVLTKITWDDAGKAEKTKGAGRLIGIFEAALVTTSVIVGQYGAVGLVLAAKSVARFEWLKDDQGKAEYFLVGTLANLTCAVLGGIIALWLAGRPVFVR